MKRPTGDRGAIALEQTVDVPTVRVPAHHHPRPKRKITKIAIFTALIAATLVFIYPFIWLISASFIPRGEVFDNKIIPEHLTFDNYLNVWQEAPLALMLYYNVLITLLAWMHAEV